MCFERRTGIPAAGGFVRGFRRTDSGAPTGPDAARRTVSRRLSQAGRRMCVIVLAKITFFPENGKIRLHIISHASVWWLRWHENRKKCVTLYPVPSETDPVCRVNLEYFIARRTARTSDGRRRGVMVRIAVLSVALSVAAMILALAVVMGFKREVARLMTGFTAHVEITDLRGADAVASVPVRRSEPLERAVRSVDGVDGMWPYAVKEGIVRTADAEQGVMLKGVDDTYDWSFFAECLTEGALPRVADSVRTKEVLVSRLLARRLGLGTGDKVEMLFVDPDDAPRRDRFRISGLYSSGMDEMDGAVVLTDLRNVQRLWGWAPDEVSGYGVDAVRFEDAEPLAGRLSHLLLYDAPDDGQNLVATGVGESYPNIFDWLKAHDVNAAVVIAVMLAVAFFNMATALMILVLERTRMIGLLKAMGMRDGAVRRIFLWRAAFIALRGLAWGNVAGLGLCFVQCRFHLLKLDSEAYLLSEVPVSLGWGWWLLLNGGAAAAIVLLLTIPARVVSTVKPSETIRYER